MKDLDPKTFLFELPIYTPIKIEDNDLNDFYSLLDFEDKIDYYNPMLGENTTYSITAICNRNLDEFVIEGGWSYARAKCVRSDDEFIFFYHYDCIKKIFMKVGQYPSIADFHIAQIKNYKNVLSKERLKEFTRAIGLAANGVGVGSFVYLRRIFEDLINEAENKAKHEAGWDAEVYRKAKMAEKIDLLQSHLPPFLVEHKSLYGILSKGVHELQEDECLAYFETVKTGIELILDEKQDAFEKQRKIEQAKQKIAALNSQIKGQQPPKA